MYNHVSEQRTSGCAWVGIYVSRQIVDRLNFIRGLGLTRDSARRPRFSSVSTGRVYTCTIFINQQDLNIIVVRLDIKFRVTVFRL